MGMCWLSVVGCWMLNDGYWLSVVWLRGCRYVLILGYWLLVVGCWRLVVDVLLVIVYCWLLARCLFFVVVC